VEFPPCFSGTKVKVHRIESLIIYIFFLTHSAYSGLVSHFVNFESRTCESLQRKSKFQKHFSFFERSGKQTSEEPGDPFFWTLCC